MHAPHILVCTAHSCHCCSMGAIWHMLFSVSTFKSSLLSVLGVRKAVTQATMQLSVVMTGLWQACVLAGNGQCLFCYGMHDWCSSMHAHGRASATTVSLHFQNKQWSAQLVG